MSPEIPYRSDPEEDAPKEVLFSSLAPETQQQLIEAVSGRGALFLLAEPTPLVGEPWHWFLLAEVSFSLLFISILSEFGHIQNGPRPFALQEAIVLASLLAGIFLGAGLWWRGRRLRQSLPFNPGLYLFPRDLIEARGATLRIYPTSKIEQILKKNGDISLVFSRGERFPIQAGRLTASYVQSELASLRKALEEAEAKDDRAMIMRLDPLWNERTAWLSRAPATPQARSSPTRRPLVLLAPSLLLASVLSWPLGLFLAEQSDLSGIDSAMRSGDTRLLSAYIQHSFARYPARAAADRALFVLAKRAEKKEPWLGYLRGGERAIEASEEVYSLLQRQRASGDEDLDFLLDFLRFGHGPRRDELDKELLERALKSDSLKLLERYAEAGRDGRAKTLFLPRKKIASAFVQKNPVVLRRLLREPIDESAKQEAEAALNSMFDSARQRLVESTRLQSSMARALERALVAAKEQGTPLRILARQGGNFRVIEDVSNDNERRIARGFHQGLRSVIETYLDKDLVSIVDAGSESSDADIEILYEVSPLVRETPSLCEVKGVMKFLARSQQAALTNQSLNFSAPHPVGALNGRTFEQAVQIALTAALLGESGRPRP